MTSNGFGCADPPAGFRHLFALLPRRFASASLRLVPQDLLYRLALGQFVDELVEVANLAR